MSVYQDSFEMLPVGRVRSPRSEPLYQDWGEVVSTIEIDDRFARDSLAGLTDFSHIEVIYVFDRIDENVFETAARHPRDDPRWPKVGIFAQRAKYRLNRIGLCCCEPLAVDGLELTVRGLDAIDGTPVLDLKPHMAELGPRGDVRQPRWSRELMRDYW